MEEYARAITEEFNRWNAAYKEASAKDLGSVETCFAAFMCNAISAAVERSTHMPVRNYFYNNADPS